MRIKLACLVLLLGWCWTPLMGQKSKGFSIESSFHYGSIMRHSEKIIYDIPKRSWSGKINIEFQTYGQKRWHSRQGFPQQGVALVYSHFGDDQVLGEAYGLLPNLSLFLWRKKQHKVRFQFGTGIAVLSRYFNAIDNPTQNAIGSSINNMVAFQFDGSTAFAKNWRASLGWSFIHYSNGASKLPNLGINISSYQIGLRYTPDPVQSKDYIFYKKERPVKRLGVNVMGGMAFNEIFTFGGPRYPVYFVSGALMYRWSPYNSAHLGIEYEYNQGIFEFSLHTFRYETRAEAKKGAERMMIFGAQEFIFGDIGVFLQVGAYISRNSYLLEFPFYNKLAVRYYLPPIGKPKTSFHLGIYLKSHKTKAEYIALALGAAI